MSLGENQKIPNVRISTSRKLSTNDDSMSKKSIEKKHPKPEGRKSYNYREEEQTAAAAARHP